MWTCGPVWTAGEKPLLRKKVLEESLFYWVCPHCGYRALMEYPCVYHDRDLGFLLCLLPEGTGDVPERLPPLPEKLRLRLVTTPAQMKEKVLLFESGYDDVAMELVKYSLTQLVVEKWHIPSATAYFTKADEKEIEFAFFPAGPDAAGAAAHPYESLPPGAGNFKIAALSR